ncbi:MAG: GTP-binding protein [Betaproteobacteria bacterium]|nr:MAG: GTP-binding protein [Betaproteobacteria bacterium]
MIPVSVLTGFLGSGKTTLLGALLRHPQMERTAVVVNELGEIGIDHDLIETSDESFVQLANGCLCCNVRSDLVLTLVDLAARRRRGEVPMFERVVIETSGLADPAPILHALMTDAEVRRHYVIGGVVTTVDAVGGGEVLERYRESVRQIALADCILLTKTDLPQAQPARVASAVRRIHPECPLRTVVRGAISPAQLFAADHRSVVPPGAPSRAQRGYRLLEEGGAHDHTSGVTSVAILRDTPVHAATLSLFLSALAGNCGERLIRMKGIVGIVEDPERPAVIHGVQHVYPAPEWLPGWPSADRRTRIVCIGHELRPAWIRELLDLLDEEVADEAALRSRTREDGAHGA